MRLAGRAFVDAWPGDGRAGPTAFVKPEIYDAREQRDVDYGIRMPASAVCAGRLDDAPPRLALPGERVVGVAAGLACLLDCFARFALEGRGTPAPVAQTAVLVASGLYRFVRNPMYVSVLIIVSGQALLLGQARLFAYAGVMLFRVPPKRAVL